MKTRWIKLACLIATSLVLTGCSSIPSARHSPINQFARFWGVGWSDGYHECDPFLLQRTPSCNCPTGLYQVSCYSAANDSPLSPPMQTPSEYAAPRNGAPIPQEIPYANPGPASLPISPPRNPSPPPTRESETVRAIPDYPKSPSDRIVPDEYEPSESGEEESEKLPPRLRLEPPRPMPAQPGSQPSAPPKTQSDLPYDPDDLLIPLDAGRGSVPQTRWVPPGYPIAVPGWQAPPPSFAFSPIPVPHGDVATTPRMAQVPTIPNGMASSYPVTPAIPRPGTIPRLQQQPVGYGIGANAYPIGSR